MRHDAVGESPDGALGISWIAARAFNEAAWGTLPESWNAPDLSGIGGLLFAVGSEAEAWFGHLVASTWFSSYVPRADDLGPGEVKGGRLSVPPVGRRGAGSLYLPTALPVAYWAAVALPRDLGPTGRDGALGVVEALRRRRDPGGGALRVVVTLEDGAGDEAFAARLAKLGAFVVRPGPGVPSSHLHHLPARILLHHRRFICIDLVDTLLLWQPGREATLHCMPADPSGAARALDAIPVPQGGALGIDLQFHHDLDHLPDGVLFNIDQVANDCTERLLRPDGDSLVTTASRLDGRTGTVDLLVIR